MRVCDWLHPSPTLLKLTKCVSVRSSTKSSGTLSVTFLSQSLSLGLAQTASRPDSATARDKAECTLGSSIQDSDSARDTTDDGEEEEKVPVEEEVDLLLLKQAQWLPGVNSCGHGTLKKGYIPQCTEADLRGRESSVGEDCPTC